MSVAINVGKLVVGTGDVREGVSIGITDGWIREITDESLDEEYDRTIDATDQVVMPGLIDAHVHLNYSGDPETYIDEVRDSSDEYLTLQTAAFAKDTLKGGVTTVGEMGAKGQTSFALRDAIADGVIVGPRIKACGSMISITGGRLIAGEPGYTNKEADGSDGVRKVTRRLLYYHAADVIKLAGTGTRSEPTADAVSSPHTGARDPQLTAAEMTTAVEEAHGCDRPVHVHAYGKPGLDNAIEAGVDVIAHGQSLTDEHIDVMLDREMILVPTLSTYLNDIGDVGRTADHPTTHGTDQGDGIVAETKPNFERAHEAGVPIAMGSDAGAKHVYHGENAQELVHMVELGMSEREAITAGTLTAAKSLGADDVLGSIEPGKAADLLVLNENPLSDISVLRNRETIDRIMIGGQFVNELLAK